MNAIDQIEKEVLKDAPPPSALPPFTDMLDAWEMADRPVPHLFRGAMPMGEASILCSEPGVGKTTLAIGLALSVAFGHELVPGYIPYRRGRVALFLGEDGAHPTAGRVRAWCEVNNISRLEYETAVRDGRLSFICGDAAALLSWPYGVGAKTPAFDELHALCAAEQYDLLVLDSLIQWGSYTEENANAVMHTVGSVLVELARASGGVVLGLAHTNKEANRTGVPSLSAIRGGSGLAGKIRWAVQLLHLGDKELQRFKIPEAESRRYMKLCCIKNQYAALAPSPLYLKRGEGGALTAADLQEEKSSRLLDAIVATLKEGRYCLTQWECSQSNGKPATEFREALRDYPGVVSTSKRAMLEALQAGYESGVLRLVQHPDNPNRKQLEAA